MAEYDVTSATGAALRDMLNTLHRRLPIVEILLAPSPVQGMEAPPALVKAIQSLALQSPDVILMARGGGSIETCVHPRPPQRQSSPPKLPCWTCVRYWRITVTGSPRRPSACLPIRKTFSPR